MVPEYGAFSQVELFIGMARDPANHRGPTFNVSQMRSGLKSILSATGFAASGDKGSRGYQIRLHLGRNEIGMKLQLSEADAADEFEPTNGPDDEDARDIDTLVSANFFDKVLSSLDGIEEVQSFLMSNDMMVAFRAQGILSGVMTEREVQNRKAAAE